MINSFFTLLIARNGIFRPFLMLDTFNNIKFLVGSFYVDFNSFCEKLSSRADGHADSLSFIFKSPKK